MNQMEYNRELLAFDEKIKLAKLEASKAAVRVDELEYQKCRFSLDIFNVSMQEQAKQGTEQAQPLPQKPVPQPEGQ